MSTPSASTASETAFPLNKFPAEIRLKIWSYNLPRPQTVHLTYDVRGLTAAHLHGRWEILNGHRSFTNLQINHESRVESLKADYVLIPLSSPVPQGFWFYYDTDIMFWNSNDGFGGAMMFGDIFSHRRPHHGFRNTGRIDTFLEPPSSFPIPRDFARQLTSLVVATKLWGGNRCLFSNGWSQRLSTLLHTLPKPQVLVVPEEVDMWHAGTSNSNPPNFLPSNPV